MPLLVTTAECHPWRWRYVNGAGAVTYANMEQVRRRYSMHVCIEIRRIFCCGYQRVRICIEPRELNVAFRGCAQWHGRASLVKRRDVPRVAGYLDM